MEARRRGSSYEIEQTVNFGLGNINKRLLPENTHQGSQNVSLCRIFHLYVCVCGTVTLRADDVRGGRLQLGIV